MSQTYYVQSLETDAVYEVTAAGRSNLIARGYRDVTAQHRQQSRQQVRRPAPAAASPGPASQNTTDTAQS